MLGTFTHLGRAEVHAISGGLGAVDVSRDAFPSEASAAPPRSVLGTWDSGVVAHAAYHTRAGGPWVPGIAQFVQRGFVLFAPHVRPVALSTPFAFRRSTARRPRVKIALVLVARHASTVALATKCTYRQRTRCRTCIKLSLVLVAAPALTMMSVTSIVHIEACPVADAALHARQAWPGGRCTARQDDGVWHTVHTQVCAGTWKRECARRVAC